MRGSEVGKKQGRKEKLKFAGLDDSDSSALTQSGDEAEESSPPHDPSGLGTEDGTEAGEDENAEMAERSSPGMFHAPSVQGRFVAYPLRYTEPVPVPKITKAQKAPKKGASTRTRSGAVTSSSRTIKKRKR